MNAPLNTVYALKEQLQLLWDLPTSSAVMAQRLDDWCVMTEATATGLAPMKRFVRTMRNHRTGICDYAEHPITTARLESGNIAVGVIRKRARGLFDLEYFKLLPCSDLAMACSLALMRLPQCAASLFGSRSPATRAWMMVWPVSSVLSVMAWPSCRFICVSAFCMCWI